MKTTKQQFEYFKSRCLFWQRKLNLPEWELYFRHKFLKESYAQTLWSWKGMKAVIELSTTWTDRLPSKHELNISACHEMLHLLLAVLSCRIETRSNEFIAELEHTIINKLLKTFNEI